MASRNPCHFKLVLLGDTAVGKSCLVVRFVRDEFFEYQEPTIGGTSAVSLEISNRALCSRRVNNVAPGCARRHCSCVPHTNCQARHHDGEV